MVIYLFFISLFVCFFCLFIYLFFQHIFNIVTVDLEVAINSIRQYFSKGFQHSAMLFIFNRRTCWTATLPHPSYHLHEVTCTGVVFHSLSSLWWFAFIFIEEHHSCRLFMPLIIPIHHPGIQSSLLGTHLPSRKLGIGLDILNTSEVQLMNTCRHWTISRQFLLLDILLISKHCMQVRKHTCAGARCTAVNGVQDMHVWECSKFRLNWPLTLLYIIICCNAYLRNLTLVHEPSRTNFALGNLIDQ